MSEILNSEDEPSELNVPEKEGDAFIDAIAKNPDDMAPRLMCADWLQEQGYADVGEFMRIQIELSDLQSDQDHREKNRQRISALRRRERKLTKAANDFWQERLSRFGVTAIQFKGGMPESVGLRVPDFVEHGQEVFSIAPVSDLRIGICPDADVLQEALAETRQRQLEQLRRLSMVNAHDGGAGVVARCRHLKNLTSLGLHQGILTEAGIREIASSKYLKKLTGLELGGNNLGSGGAEVLARAAAFKNLKNLSIWGNRIGNLGARALASSKILRNLTSLNVGSNEIGIEGIEALSNSRTLKELTIMDISGNEIGLDGVRVLLEGLMIERLTELNMSSNPIRPEVAHLIAQSEKLHKLEKLNIGEALVMGGTGVLELANSTCFGNLTELDMRRVCTILGPKEMGAIANSANFRSVNRLVLKNNSIRVEGIAEFLKSFNLPNLEELDLSDNFIGPEGAKLLAKSKALKNLKLLYLTMSGIGPEGLAALKLHLPECEVIV
ncbi:MAG: hypothetical protein A3D44_01360 [Candidatus Staskawiczbacteria bacterium RIFCSPHIGHO2_02_FULL_42_22]|uniref:TIGR02996 domain-containing protein n=1 Tax=Candidatus Staskawiczbacteria bacterium RIFCSPHIGHO2_02_FULL_42_22 TaxID=1802207 RepID=A0A1G2I0F5_9BACT|nr:MAG: hypothetical protein A3D44_01360 [Candidatus Staskawiczbacteria bacterium RIFCSPHIGHO2_02_FULL_42_22]